MKKGLYKEGEKWAKLIEKVQKEKKTLEAKLPDSLHNRLAARGKTAEEFRVWYAQVQDSKKEL